MTLSEVFSGIAVTAPPSGLERAIIAGLAYDSRKVEKDFLFFAFPGKNHDGREFARQAVERGAVAVVCESARPEGFEGAWIQVEHGRKTMALAARNLHPGVLEKLSLTGITGTNGKTTTAYILDSILRAAGKTTSLIGTIEYKLAGRPQKAVNTTPESVDLYDIFQELVRLGGSHATMEVSSHALALGRVHGIPFHTAVFTNLTRDHLDFHKTMETYFEAKRLLFADRDSGPPKYAVINRDDAWSELIEPAPETTAIWYGLNENSGLRAVRIKTDFDGVRFVMKWEGQQYEVFSPLLGKMNVCNVLAAAGAALAGGITPETIIRGVAECRAVPGRFERIEQGQPFLVVVDYAHTDDALRNVIAAARALTKKRVITVFGCGGDRDRAKRPLMGQAAAEGSDFVVLTSDNPRSEDPLAIMNDALVGLRRQDVPHKIEPDRTTGIRIALEEAGAGDIVIIAGKGHETYQVLKDRTIPYDDREVARRLLQDFGYQRNERHDPVNQ